MKTATRHLTYDTPKRRELIRITEEIQAVVDEDVLEWLDKVAPPSWGAGGPGGGGAVRRRPAEAGGSGAMGE